MKIPYKTGVLIAWVMVTLVGVLMICMLCLPYAKATMEGESYLPIGFELIREGPGDTFTDDATKYMQITAYALVVANLAIGCAAVFLGLIGSIRTAVLIATGSARVEARGVAGAARVSCAVVFSLCAIFAAVHFVFGLNSFVGLYVNSNQQADVVFLGYIPLIIFTVLGILSVVLRLLSADGVGSPQKAAPRQRSSAEAPDRRPDDPVSERERIEMLRKYKEFLDAGILSEAEFAAKKAALFAKRQEDRTCLN